MKYTDQQINAIIRGPRAFRTYAFPGADGVRVAIRVLTEAEVDECRIDAQAQIRRIAEGKKWDPVAVTDMDPEHFTRLQQRRIVFRSFYDHETTAGEPAKAERFFSVPGDVDALDTTTVQRCFDLYLEHQRWVSPLRSMEEDEVKALVEALGKEQGSEVLLIGYEPSALRSLLISMARLQRSSG